MLKERVHDTTRTKIVGTIGPSSAATSTIREMIRAGMTMARINFSHGGVDHNIALIETVREVAKEEGVMIGIIQDLQGPKLRVGEIRGDTIELKEGELLMFKLGAKEAENGKIPIPNRELGRDLRPGDTLLLRDGMMEVDVLGVDGVWVTTRVVLGGELKSNQGLTVPSRALAIESLTEKDKTDLALGLQHNVDYVALSFVRTVEDVQKLKQLIIEWLPTDTVAPGVIVKVEKREAVDNFSEILVEADAVMVARGDLGLETSVGEVPVTQKDIIAKCVVAGKPVITATQMLSSMTTRPRPTRAEASDVANAVIDHTDAVMLSEETAIGRYPVQSVTIMAEIIARTEETSLDDLVPEPFDDGASVPWAVSGAAARLAKQVGAKAILVTTQSGYSARAVARFRATLPVYGATSSARVARQLSLSWGLIPLILDAADPIDMVVAGLRRLVDDKLVKSGDTLVVVSGLRSGDGFDSSVRVVEI